MRCAANTYARDKSRHPLIAGLSLDVTAHGPVLYKRFAI